MKVGDVRPFLKWAGGKSYLLPQLASFIPKAFENYYEPFFGGGAFYFYLINHGYNFTPHINDINNHLINAYRHVRDDLPLLSASLMTLQNEYLSLSTEERKNLYYKLRLIYNEQPHDNLARAALLIFLNRTGYNGMYRENLKGEYNIPFGREKNSPTICNTENLKKASRALSYAVLTSGPYEEAVMNAQPGDFVYLDPPYYPSSATSRFTRYTEHDFQDEEQFTLKEVFDGLSQRGCKVMMSNSKTAFISKLYRDYRMETVLATRSLNSKGTGRGKVEELVILNY